MKKAEEKNFSFYYIVNKTQKNVTEILDYWSLQGLSNLKVLDLSNNEIVLKEADLGFLSHTPRLTEVCLNSFILFPSYFADYKFSLCFRCFRVSFQLLYMF